MTDQRTAHVLIASDASFEFETPPRIYTDKDAAIAEYRRLFGILENLDIYDIYDVPTSVGEDAWTVLAIDSDGHENESLILLFDVSVVEG